MANRDAPVSSMASLNLTSGGDLVLLENLSSYATPIWAAGTRNLSVVSAQIQDSGNFVLLNSTGGMVWQSFDRPTDTVVPGQHLKTNAQLISRKNAVSYSSGRYALDFPTSGNVRLKYTESVPGYVNISSFPAYWSQGAAAESINSSLTFLAGGQLNQSGFVNFYNVSGQTYASFLASDAGASGAIRRLTLDADGNLRTYSWDQPSTSWIITWKALSNPCDSVQGLCGPYGICIYKPQSACVCPSGFDVVDDTDISQGCTPRLPVDCNSTKYVVLENTNYPFNDMTVFPGISSKQCMQSCSDSCGCLGAVYNFRGAGTCFLKDILFNGAFPILGYQITILKVSHTEPSTSLLGKEAVTNWTSGEFWQQESSSSSGTTPSNSLPPAYAVKDQKGFPRTIAVISSVTAAETMCLVIVIYFYLRKNVGKLRKSRLSSSPTERVPGSTSAFSYQELEAATNNFNEILGSGGFGTVYKGRLADGRLVAVKRLKTVSKIEKQFEAEIASMSTAHHVHLIRLYGFCADNSNRLLVYEYMENGSLDSFLFLQPGEGAAARKPTLDWKKRFNIGVGTARAIAYLHEDCTSCIIHCDIKPQNILIDKNFCPKVADFGLAYLFNRNHTLQVTTVHGTRGYLAPEWLSHLPITGKADVYSFGMLLLEIVSGRSNYSFTSTALGTGTWCFPVWAFEQMRQGNLLDIIDASILGSMEYEEVERVLNVAFWCIQKDVAARPTMGKVVQMLMGTVTFVDPPPPTLLEC